MRRFSQREGLHTLSEINVTPMLDLCFVLLVIFMITTPLLESNNDLALPSGNSTSPNADPDKVHTITVDRNEALTLDGQAGCARPRCASGWKRSAARSRTRRSSSVRTRN